MGKVPPYSLEAEQSVLGSMILDKDAINTAVEELRADDFYKEANKKIFSSIVELFNKSEPVDLVTLSEDLNKKSALETIGGVAYLAELSGSVAITSNIKYYCDIVKEKSLLRTLIKSCDEVMALSYEDEEEVSFIIETAEKNIFDITQGRHKDGFSEIRDVLMTSFDKIEELSKHDGGLTGLTTGFVDLDRTLSGMQSSDLILLAARPSMGKTALGINIAVNAALEAQAHVAVFSLEMSKEQLAQRMMSSVSHVGLQNIIAGDLDEDQWLRLIDGMAPLSTANINR